MRAAATPTLTTSQPSTSQAGKAEPRSCSARKMAKAVATSVPSRVWPSTMLSCSSQTCGSSAASTFGPKRSPKREGRKGTDSSPAEDGIEELRAMLTTR